MGRLTMKSGLMVYTDTFYEVYYAGEMVLSQKNKDQIQIAIEDYEARLKLEYCL